MALSTHKRIRPTDHAHDVRDAHRFMVEKMRSYRQDNRRWPTVEELLELAVSGAKAGEWNPRNGSEEFRTHPENYFRGYILSALRPARQVFEYDTDDRQ